MKATEKNVKRVLIRYKEVYNKLYNGELEELRKYVELGEFLLKIEKPLLEALVKARDYDPFVSDRELCALAMAYEDIVTELIDTPAGTTKYAVRYERYYTDIKTGINHVCKNEIVNTFDSPEKAMEEARRLAYKKVQDIVDSTEVVTLFYACSDERYPDAWGLANNGYCIATRRDEHYNFVVEEV